MAKQSTPAPEEFFGKVMDQASAGYALYCRQACRGLKIYMAVHVFGVGTLLPNDLSDRESRDKPVLNVGDIETTVITPSQLPTTRTQFANTTTPSTVSDWRS